MVPVAGQLNVWIRPEVPVWYCRQLDGALKHKFTLVPNVRKAIDLSSQLKINLKHELRPVFVIALDLSSLDLKTTVREGVCEFERQLSGSRGSSSHVNIN